MKINVTYEDTLPESVTLYVDGVCAHSKVVEDLVEDDNGHNTLEMFCDNCGAWYNDLDDKWLCGKKGYLYYDRGTYKAPF